MPYKYILNNDYISDKFNPYPLVINAVLNYLFDSTGYCSVNIVTYLFDNTGYCSVDTTTMDIFSQSP